MLTTTPFLSLLAIALLVPFTAPPEPAPGPVSGTWTVWPGAQARDIAATGHGSAYMVNVVGKIYKRRASWTDWKQLAGSDGLCIAAVYDGGVDRVSLSNTAGLIYHASFQEATIAATTATVWNQQGGSDADDVAWGHFDNYMVNTVGRVYPCIGTKYQQPLDGVRARRIAAGHTAGNVWVLDVYGAMYKKGTSGWTLMPRPTDRANDIAIGEMDGSVWCCTNTTIYKWNPSANSWTTMATTPSITASRITVFAANTLLVTAGGKIYQVTF